MLTQDTYYKERQKREKKKVKHNAKSKTLSCVASFHDKQILLNYKLCGSGKGVNW